MVDILYSSSAQGRAVERAVARFATGLADDAAMPFISILRFMHEPYRVGVANLQASSDGQASPKCTNFSISPQAPHACVFSAVPWPAAGGGVDALVVISQQPVSTRVRWRLEQGIEAGFIVASPADIPAVLRERQAEVVAARTRVVIAMLRQAFYFHNVQPSPELLALVELGYTRMVNPAQMRVAIIGPNQQQVARTKERLQALSLVEKVQQADIVVAVAPPGGWRPADIEGLRKVWEVVGRLVTMGGPAHQMAGIGYEVIDEEALNETVEAILAQRCQQPPDAPTLRQAPKSTVAEQLHRSNMHLRVWHSLKDKEALRCCLRDIMNQPAALAEAAVLAGLCGCFIFFMIIGMMGVTGLLALCVTLLRAYARTFALARQWLIKHPERDPDARARWLAARF